MKIADFFIKLGISGAEKTGDALSGVRGRIGDMTTASLAAKASIVGMIYGLERLMSASGKTGTSLFQFSTLTGLSSEKLQRFQYAGRQAGATFEETASSIRNAQNAMTQMLMGKAPPDAMNFVSRYVGLDPRRATQDAFYLFQKLQEMSTKVRPDIAANLLRSFGISDGSISAMMAKAYSEKNFAKAPVYSDAQRNQLMKTDAAWANLGDRWEKSIGKLNAKYGMELVKDLSKVTDSFIKLLDVLEKISQKMHLIELVGKTFEGMANTLKLAVELFNLASGMDSKPGDILYTKPGQDFVPGFKDSPVGKFFRSLVAGEENRLGIKDVTNTPFVSMFSEKPRATTTQNLTVINHGVKETGDVGAEVKRAVNRAAWSSPALKRTEAGR